MLTLTVAIAVPNIQKMHVTAVQLDDVTNTATVTCNVQGSGGRIFGVYALQVADGSSQGLRAKVTPVGYGDQVEVFTTSTPTGFTDLLAGYTGASLAARNRNAETALVAAGLLPAGSVA